MAALQSLDTQNTIHHLLAFLQLDDDTTVEKYMNKQCKADSVRDVMVMGNIEGQKFHFALVTYNDLEAVQDAATSFRSRGIYCVRVTLNKKSTIKSHNETMQMPGVSNALPQVSLLEIAGNDALALDLNTSKCYDIFEQYQRTKDLKKVITSLTDSLIFGRIEFFVSSLLLKGLDGNTKVMVEMGTLISKLLTNNSDLVKNVNQGIDLVLKDWTVHMLNFPYFLPFIASAIAPLILKCKFYDFYYLKQALNSLNTNVSSVLLIEILKILLENTDQVENIKSPGGLIWVFYKWTISENITLESFMPCDKLNKYFEHGRLGVFFLTIAMYDKMKRMEKKEVYSLMRDWIEANISSEIINDPIFVRALTIAIVFKNLKHYLPYGMFFNYITGELLAYYVKLRPNGFPRSQIQAREIQCLYGILTANAVINYPKNLVLKLFVQLFRESIVSAESFKIWKDENQPNTKYIEDQETKIKALASFDWNNLLNLFVSDYYMEQ